MDKRQIEAVREVVRRMMEAAGTADPTQLA